MPQYSIMHDRPWVEQPGRASHTPSASLCSEVDVQSMYRDSKMPEVPPLKPHKRHPRRPSTAHTQNADHDAPPARQSKMLIFRQVKSLLHKPSRLDMSRIGRPRDSSLSTASPATEGRTASGTSTRDGYQVRQNWSARESASAKDASPISALRDGDMERTIPPGSDLWPTMQREDFDQISHVADFAYPSRGAPSQVAPTTRSYALPDTPCPTAGLSSTKRSASKTLPPLPPDMATSYVPKTHLQGLLAKEDEIIFQRKNIEKAIVENAKIESASPLDVAFSEVRAAKKELESLRARLEEIKLEERDIGIAIARARRKEGSDDEGGLWVRRVTG
ncbi:hypothetical protein BST61_g2065 [Cercospora zeina]